MKSVVYKKYKPKKVLNVHKHIDGGWFWDKYSAFPYIGCYYGCEYCYWRDEKYNRLAKEMKGLEDPFSQYIKIKENAAELLRKELRGKKKDIIYIDSYQPIESKYSLVRKMLEVCLEMNFPVFINEKSPLILKDIDLLKKISESSYLNVGFSIIFPKDNKAKKVFESRAPTIASRFNAMKILGKEKIVTGTVLIPILPFICDREKDIEEIVRKTKENGGIYVLDGGLTLFGYCKTHFYRSLKKYNSSLVEKYKKLYSDSKKLGEYYSKIHELVKKYCEKYGVKNYIPREVKFYPKELQLNKKVAEMLFLKAREIMMTKGPCYEQYSYLKAGWSVDELKENVGRIYKEERIDGLIKLKGVGRKIAGEIVEFISKLKK